MNNLIYGNEPYLIQAQKKKIVSGIKYPSMNLLILEEFNEEALIYAQQIPFMEDKRTVIVCNQSLEQAIYNEGIITEYLDSSHPSTYLYILVSSIDKRRNSFKMMQKYKVEIIIFNKNETILQTYIIQFLKNKNCSIRKEAYEKFVERINYFMEGVSMYDVLNTLNRLVFIKGEITSQMIEEHVPANGEEKIFQLVEMLCKGKYNDLFLQVELLRLNGRNDTIGILSLMLRGFRIRYKLHLGFLPKDIGTYYTNETRIDKCQIIACIHILQTYLDQIKTGRMEQFFAANICIAKLIQIIEN